MPVNVQHHHKSQISHQNIIQRYQFNSCADDMIRIPISGWLPNIHKKQILQKNNKIIFVYFVQQ